MEFRISTELKNIIGKDLITDDQVAIFELVKNSYDAYATHVDVLFYNNKIVIRDDGKGMSKDDLEHKWLFVAYSAKKDGTEDNTLKDDKQFADYRDKINLKKSYAGAKGIGRFSSDRLGVNLRIISKQVNSNEIHQLDINWQDFEHDAQEDFINIQVKYELLKDSNYEDFEHGVILEITNLRSTWSDEKIDKLKKSLAKLINPFESNKIESTFKIYIKPPQVKIKELIQNSLLEILELKTTKIEVRVNNDKIISSLTDRGTLIYEIEEHNPFEYLKNSSMVLLFLNRKAKHNFTMIMGMHSVNFSHVMMYNNGIRVYPFGEPGDDSFGIDRRHQQGHSRTLSTRNIIGSININESSNEFKEKTSRDGGLIATDGYIELKDFFLEKGLKRLEKYVVGVQWKLEPNVRKLDQDAEDSILLENLDSRKRSIELITKLIDKDGINIKKYDSDFLNLIDDEVDAMDPVIKQLSQLAEKTGDKRLLNSIEKTQKELLKVQEANKRAVEEREKAEQQKILVEEKYKIVLKEKEKVEKKLEIKRKESNFKSTLLGKDIKEIIGMQHQVRHSSSRIKRNVKLLLKSLNVKELTEKQKKRFGIITLEASKINSLSNYIEHANFDLTVNHISTDILSFIEEYINELYLANNRTIDSKLNIKVFDSSRDEYIMNILPLELTMVIDNFIHNSENADASNIVFRYENTNKELIIFVEDDGKGIDENDIDEIFDLGYTTTEGSGIGLFNIQQTIVQMGGNIETQAESNTGAKFIIRFKK